MFNEEKRKEILKAIEKYWNLINDESEWIFSRELLMKALEYFNQELNPFLYLKEEMEKESLETFGENLEIFQNNKLFFILFEKDKEVLSKNLLANLGLEFIDPKNISLKEENYPNKLGFYFYFAISEYLLHNREVYRYNYHILDSNDIQRDLQLELTKYQKLLQDKIFSEFSENQLESKIKNIEESLIENTKWRKQSKEILEKTQQHIRDWKANIEKIKPMLKKLAEGEQNIFIR